MTQIVYKVLLIGDTRAGKSCLLKYENPPVPYTPNLGIDLSLKRCTLKNEQEVLLQCWDLAGAETFRSIQYTYFSKCKACLVMFDVTSMSSFDSVMRWINKISDYGDQSNPLLFLVGSKIDLQDERVVSSERAGIFADQLGLRYIEVSSFRKHNVELIFQLIAEEIFNRGEH